MSSLETIYDYYKESACLRDAIKSYVGVARYGSRIQASDAGGDRFLRLVSPKYQLPVTSSSLSAYSEIIHCLWDEVIPTGPRQPTHWVDCGYIRNRVSESILCLPVRLTIPSLSTQSSAIRIAGYLQAVAEQIPPPTWTSTQQIGIEFCERYTGLILKGLIAGWAHERGYMDRLRSTLSV